MVFAGGRLRWNNADQPENGTPFEMPRNTAVPVGEHVKGFNKTIGKTVDGAKKRFWLGRDRDEAIRKAAWITNVFEKKGVHQSKLEKDRTADGRPNDGVLNRLPHL